MANHLFTRPGGIWADDTDLLAAELADLDAKTVDSISATGGVYSLTEDLIIGAPDGTLIEFDCLVTFPDRLVVNTLEVSGTGTFGGDATFLGNTTIGEDENTIFTLNSYTTFNGIAGFYNDVLFAYGTHFYGNAQFEADVSLNSPGNTLTVAGDIDVGNGIDVQGFGTFRSALSCEGVFTAYAGSSLNGTTTCQNALVVQGVTTHNGVVNNAAPWGSVTGGMYVPRYTDAANADASYGPRTCDVLVIGPGLSAGHSYTIDDTGAVDGATMRFVSQHSVYYGDIKNPGGTIIARVQSNTGQYEDLWVRRKAGAWEILRGHIVGQ